MKRLLSIVIASALISGWVEAQDELPVGTLSQNVKFALLQNGLSNATLSEFEGNVVVLYYYTQW